MAVTVNIPAVLRRYSAGEATVAVTGSNVAEALHDLFSRFPALEMRVLDARGALFHHLLLFRNDHELARDVMAAQPLDDGDVLDLVAAAAGG